MTGFTNEPIRKENSGVIILRATLCHVFHLDSVELGAPRVPNKCDFVVVGKNYFQIKLSLK